MPNRDSLRFEIGSPSRQKILTSAKNENPINFAFNRIIYLGNRFFTEFHG